MQVVERWILMRLRHQRFVAVDDVNEAIEPLLARLNGKPFQKLPGSRASAFADLDAPALQALPLQPWEWAAFKSVRVHIDHHVEIEGHRYSVPQNLVGLLLEARITAHAVELLHRGQRVSAREAFLPPRSLCLPCPSSCFQFRRTTNVLTIFQSGDSLEAKATVFVEQISHTEPKARESFALERVVEGLEVRSDEGVFAVAKRGVPQPAFSDCALVALDSSATHQQQWFVEPPGEVLPPLLLRLLPCRRAGSHASLWPH